MKLDLSLSYFKNLLNFWKNTSYILIILLLTPIAMLIFYSFQNNFETWLHLFNTKLSLYFFNTFFLMLGVGSFSLVIGISCAWIVTKYKFFLSNYIEWALLLPAAIPAYIVAYSYTDFLEYGGIVQTMLRDIFNWQSSKEYYFPDIRSMIGAIFILSFALYPYIYFITKAAFRSTPKSLFDVAKIHGKSGFIYVALPMARPAIIAGLSLVLMETISDFGTGSGSIIIALAKYYKYSKCFGIDRCPLALSLAKENVLKNQLESRIDLSEYDWTHQQYNRNNVDLLVANPPYLSEREWDSTEPEVKDYDPKIALVASNSGKSDIEAILKKAPKVLTKSGMLAMEFGLGQSEFITEKCKGLFTDILIKKDLSGIRRFFIGKLKG